MARTGTEWSLVWADRILDLLIANGVRRFCFSPGARSIPLLYCLWAKRDKVEIRIQYDERSMGFYAMGQAHALGEPVACITTSGSAVANLLPAAVEAKLSCIPLLLLTADRPAELRGTGANQTIWQPGIFGKYVGWGLDLPCPAEEDLQKLEEWISEGMRVCVGNPPQPVHWNVPFREPLISPEAIERWQCNRRLSSVGVGEVGKGSGRSLELENRGGEWRKKVDRIVEKMREIERGVILVGELPPIQQHGGLEEIRRLGLRLRWPVVVTPLSGMKSWGGKEGLIFFGSRWLPKRGVELPEFVLWLGGRIVSRGMEEFFGKVPGKGVLQVRRYRIMLDPYIQHPEVIIADEVSFCRECYQRLGVFQRGDTEWSRSWAELDDEVGRAFKSDQVLLKSEEQIARVVFDYCKTGGVNLFLGNSRAVRDFDMSAGGVGQRFCVFGQRGASGIDGNVAHVAGFASATREFVVGLLGDYALLHDLNSLRLIRDLPVGLVVVNNDGGGIFWSLRLDLPEEFRREFLQDPHGFHFGWVCRMYGLEYAEVRVVGDLVEALNRARAERRAMVVEVPIVIAAGE